MTRINILQIAETVVNIHHRQTRFPPAFSNAFWCILQLFINEKRNNLCSIHTRITSSIFHDIFSSSVASVAKLGHPDTSTMPRVNKLETWEVFVHKSTPHNRHHKHQARSFVVKKYFQPEVEFTILGAEWVLQGRHPVGYWGEALKGGQWPHCPLAFWTVILWRLFSHTYTWSKLKPLWPTAQAQYDPLFPPFSTPAQFLWPEAQAGESSCLSSCP